MSAELDVFLRGSRGYVQGTQLIAQVGFLSGRPDARFVSASFSSLTDHTVLAYPVGRNPDAEGLIGSVTYTADGERLTFDLFEGVKPAPRLDDSMGISIELIEQRGKWEAAYTVHHDGRMESRLNGIVQCAKDLHERLGTVFDVWFTGARGFDLAIKSAPANCIDTINFTPRRCMRNGQQYQSMLHMQLRTSAEDGIYLGHIIFAFKSLEVIDVD